MKKLVIVAILSLLLLAACGGSKTTGKRVAIPSTSGNSITGNAVLDVSGSEEVSEKTAAEVLKELQSAQDSTLDASGPKSGTFYPPVTVTGTEREALKQKTRALFQKSVYAPTVDADATSGSRYYGSDGEPDNLPQGYGGDDRNGE